MTRCSYIPPEGLSVIAIAKERGGTTDGDVQALVDRFGCKAEATHEIAIGDADEPDQLLDACRDHVGHLLGNGGCWVHPIVEIETAMSIVFGPSVGVARAGFGPAIILSQSPAAPPVVNLGTNPTREQLEAHGFDFNSAAYREARAAFEPMPLPTPQTVGVALPRAAITDATPERTHSDARRVIDLCSLLRSLPGVDKVAFVEYECGDVEVFVDGGRDEQILAHLFDAVPSHKMRGEISATVTNSSETNLRDVAFSRGAQAVDLGPVAGVRFATATWGSGFAHNYRIRADETPPYAVGDEVEWQPGPFGYDSCWTRGRVTSIVDDRPDDGIDKPFWIVRVDTAGERRFVGPAVAVCLRRPRTA